MRPGWRGIFGVRGAVLALVLMASVVLLATPAPARAVSFPDVGAHEWFAEAVDVLSDLGIVQGKADGTFHPYDPVSRAEFSVFLSRALGLAPGSGHPFTDFPPGAWFEPAVAALFQAGLVNGVSPDGVRSRGTGIATAGGQLRDAGARLQSSMQPIEGLDPLVLQLDPSQVETWLQGFPDRDSIADAHQPAVANAYRLQIVAGQSDGRY